MKEKEAANARRKSSIFSSFALTGTSKASKDKEQAADRDDDNFEKNYEDKEEVIVSSYTTTTTVPLLLLLLPLPLINTNTNTTTN